MIIRIYLLLVTLISGGTVDFTKYEVYRRRWFGYNYEFSFTSPTVADCIFALRAHTPESGDIAIAVYKELSKSCLKPSLVNQTLFLLENDDDNMMVLWSTNVCTLSNGPRSFYYERKYTDVYEYDLGHTGVSSLTECANFCENESGNDAKSFVYAIADNACFCKRISIEEYIEYEGSPLFNVITHHYNRLCFF